MKIIFLSSYDGGRFIKRSPDPDNNNFYTYGWHTRRAKILKKVFPKYDIEVWRYSKNTIGYFEKNIEDIKFKVYPAFRIKYIIDFSFKGFKDLLKLSKRESILLYLPHVHHTLTYLVALIFKDVPIVVQDDGEIPPKLKTLSKNPFRKVLYKFNLFAEKLAFKNIDFFCLADQNQIQFIKEVFPKFKGKVTPSMGLDLSIFYPMDKIAAKQKLGWDLNKKYILYVGRLEKIKNVDELIKVWIEIKKEMAEVELVFIGGIETDPFYNFAKEKNVIMYPIIMNVDLSLYYSAADVYVLLGLDNLNFAGMGIAPAESLACGTPVVSSNLRNILGGTLEGIGEAPQTLEGHKEAIIKVLKNPGNYTKCRDVIVQYYTEEAAARRLDDIIKQVLTKYSDLK